MLIDFTPDQALYPFTSRWFDSSQGRVIMFFHGNPTWSFLYREIITGLRDQFRCIAVDYLGFGLSERPSGFNYRIEQHAQGVGELVDQLNLDGYLTMGQDWGGPISMVVDGDHMLVELPDAKHYIQEDAPERITEAIRDRFG